MTGREEAQTVLRSFFGGSVTAMFSSFMSDGVLPKEEADELRRMIDQNSALEIGEYLITVPAIRPWR